MATRLDSESTMFERYLTTCFVVVLVAAAALAVLLWVPSLRLPGVL